MSGISDFQHEIGIQPNKLGFQQFNASNPVREFDSGNPDLDSFLCTEEVAEYDRQNLGRTTLVYYESQLVAFFTVCVDGLALDYVVAKKTAKSHVKLGDATVDRIPSIKIGRLAVDQNYQNIGIGRFIIKRIIGYALDISDQFAVRLIIVESKPQSIDFYLKCGFQRTIETKGQKRRKNRTLFFDLDSIRN